MRMTWRIDIRVTIRARRYDGESECVSLLGSADGMVGSMVFSRLSPFAEGVANGLVASVVDEGFRGKNIRNRRSLRAFITDQYTSRHLPDCRCAIMLT